MGARLASVCSRVMGPAFPPISLVPARITTTLGWSAITSCWKRISMCGVACPLTPRLTYGLPLNEPWGPVKCQASVMESPMKTTRSSSAAGGPNAKSASLYLSGLAQAVLFCSLFAFRAGATGSAVGAGGVARAVCAAGGALVSGTFPGSWAARLEAATSAAQAAAAKKALRGVIRFTGESPFFASKETGCPHALSIVGNAAPGWPRLFHIPSPDVHRTVAPPHALGLERYERVPHL